MAKRKGRGFKAPKHFDPNRARQPKRHARRGHAAEPARDDARDTPQDGQRQERRDHRGEPRHERRESWQARERFSPAADIVRERITAKRTSAADVEGLTFGGLGLGNNIVETLKKLGANRPFPIQGATIPDALAGRNVLGRARTGSGKTIAFGAPMVERLLQLKAAGRFAGDPPRAKAGEKHQRRSKTQGRKPKALILAPTRELALQIDRTIQPIARSVGLYTTQVYGGVPQAAQVSALRMGVDIVIGTPGRMEDLIEQGHLDLGQVVIAVVDEADHMCDLGFLEPVQRLMRQTRRDAQVLLFSATLDTEVSELVGEFLPKHVAHEVAGDDAVSGTIDHRVFVVLREAKREVLNTIVRTPGKILVFTRTRAYAEQLAEQFTETGIKAVSLHGDLSQARRTRNLQQFTTGKVRVLVATDVAARGIHIDDVDLVVQADPPDEYKTYMHRAGRTGRAGKHGIVVTVIPRTGQRRTKEMLQRAEIVPSFFGDVREGDDVRLVSATPTGTQ